MNRNDLERYCNEYPPSRIQPLLLRFQHDESSARRHWPWAAVAISLYIFEKREHEKYIDELKPEEVIELLSQIKQSAHDLQSALCSLQTFANRLTDPNAPLRRPHLAWLDAFITQAAAGRISSEINDNSEQMSIDFFRKMTLLKRLAEIEAAAITAAKRIDSTLLKRKRGQSDPALPRFVSRCSTIWKSLTGRKPSAQKVHNRRGCDPDFAIFVQELEQIGQASPPSRNQIATSLKNQKRFRTARA
jgi:hypothetical protein